MRLHPFLLCATAALGAALLQAPLRAQPNLDPAAPRDSTYTLEELERFINGRTLVTLDLKDATLQEVADALTQNLGRPVAVQTYGPRRTITAGLSFSAPMNPAPSTKTITTNPTSLKQKTYSLKAEQKPVLGSDAAVASGSSRNQEES